MKKKLYVYILLNLIFTQNLFTQNFDITSVDEQNFPLIKVIIQSPKNEYINPDSIKVIDNGKEVRFTIDTIKKTTLIDNKTVLFLIHSKPKDFVYKDIITDALSESLDILAENKINIAFADKNTNSGSYIHFLSAEFTTDINILKDIVYQHFNKNFTSNEHIDYKQVFDELVLYFGKRAELQDPKNVIIITTDKIQSSEIAKIYNKDYTNFFDLAVFCIDNNAPKQQNSKNGNTFIFIVKPDDLVSEIIKYVADLSKKNIYKDKIFYRINFVTSQNNNINQFEININGEKRRSTFTNNKTFILTDKNIFWILILSFTIVLIIIFLLYIYNRRKISDLISKNHRLYLQEIEKENKILRKELTDLRNKLNLLPPEFNEFDPTLTVNVSKIPVLIIKSKNFTKTVEISKPTITIGRDASNDVIIPDQTISNKHAALKHENGKFFITDNKSTNGTYVNDLKIDSCELKNGDIIKMGSVFIQLRY